jgi:hypothetical protein
MGDIAVAEVRYPEEFMAGFLNTPRNMLVVEPLN